MKKRKKIFRIILIVLLVPFVVIQFIRPEKNIAEGPFDGAVEKHFKVAEPVMSLLKTACTDCHSNNTVYPWYSQVQPVGWWLADHVDHGKGHLNFDELGNLPPAVQYHKFEEIVEVTESGEMPLDSYTWVHKDAVLDEDQKTMLMDWAKACMKEMEATYPPDSLIFKRRRKKES